MDLAEYVFRPLRESEEFILHWDLSKQAQATSVLTPVSVSPVTRFLRFAAVIAIAFRWLRKRELIRRDLKPSKILADSTNGGDWMAGLPHRYQKDG